MSLRETDCQMNDPYEHVRKNRARWDAIAKDYVAAGERAWKCSTPCWGIWGIPESRLHLIPDDLVGYNQRMRERVREIVDVM